MSADSPRRSSGGATRGMVSVPAIVPPQVVSDRSILDSAIGFINEVTLAHQPLTDPKDTITWARFETAADISDPRFGEDWELEGNVAPPLLLILGYGLGVQVWAIPANGEAVEVLSWRHGIVSALRVLPTPSSAVAIDENGRADEPIDTFAEKRPLIALVDGSSSSGTQPQFCAVNFISLKTGTQVKTIKFKNPVIDVLANRSSIVITFHERIAVFDARTLDDRLSITTCYPSPGINPNPVALGPRWLAYAEHKLLHSKRSGGGCDGDGVASYTATVLNASKSLVKGLRELGEQVAAGLTGTSGSAGSSKNTSFDSGLGPDSKQSGIVTIIDVKNSLRDNSPPSGVPISSNQTAGTDPIIAHFIAHSEALVAMEFDNSGMILVTADRRGHDFHVFRIQPNPVGPSLAAVHHLYVLHRGDTSAKVQNISLSLDTRWVAVSTLRGTTHVFPITPYGGPMGVRTHTSLHVVNKLSRFHRSAGLSAEGRSNSPISHSESTTFIQSLQPYHNPTLPPFHRPTVVMPLAQLRQPFALGSPPASATLAGVKCVAGGGSGSGSQRQRLSSLSDDSGKPLSVCAIFAKSRSWLLDPPNVTREAPHRMQRKAVDSLFVMAGHGALIQYDLDTKLASNVAKEKICDDTPIDLEVEAKAQWNLGRRKEGSQEIMPPLSLDNWLIKNRNSCMLTDSTRQYDDSDDRGESWLAQVEIVTHAGPHRRLWMGPQFVFKTYNTPSGSNLSHVDIEAVEIGTSKSSTATTTPKPEHSSPLNMPLTAAGRSSAVPVLIESSSYSSIEQSPKLMDRFRHDHLDSDYSVAHGDSRLKEDLADAMRESPCVAASKKDCGRGCETGDNIAFYDALTDHDDQDDQDLLHARTASAAALASALPNIHSYDNSCSYESLDSLKKQKASIEKIVNPLGTVTTVTSCLTADVKTDILDEVVSQLAAEDTIIHENCDESLFRPVVAIFCDENTRLKNEEEARKNEEFCQPPEAISNKLVVPVIAKEVDDELNKKEKQKNNASKVKLMANKEFENLTRERSRFEELSSLNKKSKAAIEKQEQSDNIVKIVKDIAKADETGVTVKEMIFQGQQTATECGKLISKFRQSEKSSETVKGKVCIEKSDCTTAKGTTEKRTSPDYQKAEEEPLEFIRMTPKLTPQKILSKKEIKKQQQKAKDESICSGNSKKIEVEQDKIEKSLEKNYEEKPVPDVPKTDILGQKKMQAKVVNKLLIEQNIDNTADDKIIKKAKSVNENTKPELMNENPKDKCDIKIKTYNKSADITATQEEPVKFVSIKKEKCDKDTGAETKQMMSASPEEKAETALNYKTVIKIEADNKSVDKTTTQKEHVKLVSIDKSSCNKDTASEKKQMISTSSEEKSKTAFNVKLSPIDKTAIKEEIKTTSKKVKLGSGISETKDVIKTEQVNVKELADSLVDLKDDEKNPDCAEKIESVDVISDPKKASKKNKRKGNKSESNSENEEIVEVIQKLNLERKTSNSEDISKGWAEKDIAEETNTCSLTNKAQEEIDPDAMKKVVVHSSEKGLKVKNIVMKQKLENKQEQNVTKSKENNREVKKSEDNYKDITKDLLSDDKKLLETEKKLYGAKLVAEVVDGAAPNKTTNKKDELKKFQEEKKTENKPTEESQTKTADKDNYEKENVIKADDALKVYEKKCKAMSVENPEKLALKENQTKFEEPKKNDKIYIKSNFQEDQQKPIAIREKQKKISDEKSSCPKTRQLQNTDLKEIQHEQDSLKSSSEKRIQMTIERNELSNKIIAPLDEINKYKVAPPLSPKKKVKDAVQDETIEIESATKSSSDAKANKEIKKSEDIDDSKQWQNVSKVKEGKKNMELYATISNTKEVIEKEKPKAKGGDLSKQFSSDSCKKMTEQDLSKKLQTPYVCSASPGTSAWKTLSGAEMINKNFNISDTDTTMGAIRKSTASKTPVTIEKLLPQLSTSKEELDSLSLCKISKKTKKAPTLDDFTSLKPLDSLPPLPALEPLELLSDSRTSNLKDFSLINFESPLQENPALQRKITPPPRGFTEQNLIFALCGSLHYENEHKVRSSPDKQDLSQTVSSNRSFMTLDEPSIADYTSLTENDDPYISLEQSSHDTTSNTKFSSSTNSSGSEEIIIMEEKKMTKKQKRKRQQQQQVELQKQKEHQQELDDEELIPLITMTESQIDQIPDGSNDTTLPTTSMKTLTHSTSTDSEGPMPATTSDDNLFTIPAPVAHSQHKIKTKKLEHKINLIAAIEAATSSSTSSAEESGVELGGRSPHDNDESLISVVNSVAATTLPLPIVVAPQTNVGALKKKTKRRKR